MSNATTTIEVAGVSMTVAEAIERKTSIDYDIRYLRKLKRSTQSWLTGQNKSMKM
ncbi:hypothetical protein OE903_14905 [Bacillus sp. B6(2022)]|nr:hypothetical protein [Bacillus sp. B6(2022)]